MIEIPLVEGGYRAALIDCPWSWKSWSDKGYGKSPQAHYSCTSTPALESIPIYDRLARDAYVFMWATFPMLPDALALMGAWGLSYATGAAWAKQSRTGKAWAFGTGYIFRSAAELLLVGKKGHPSPKSRSIRNLIIGPVREHSRKVDSVYGIIEQIAGEGPYLELFARQQWPGWVCIGNESDRFEAIPGAQRDSGSPNAGTNITGG